MKKSFEELQEEFPDGVLKTELEHKGPMLISGYESNLYNELLKDWHREERTAYSQVHSKTKGILWMNFEPIRQIRLEEVMSS